MRLNSKVTWGLAWTGLAVVLAVPSADFLTGRMGDNKAAVLTSTTDPVKTASVTTTKTANGVIITPAGAPVADPVDKLIKTGKPLPSYISDGTTPAAPTQVASIDPVATPTAPTPFPSWARPVAAPKQVVAAPKQVIVKSTEPALIVDDSGVIGQQASVAPTAPAASSVPRPPAPIVDDSANWDSETLRQYLDRKGLLDGALASDRSSASVTTVERPSGTYDSDGFYLSDGPNGDRARRRARVNELFLDDQGDDTGFNLF